MLDASPLELSLMGLRAARMPHLPFPVSPAPRCCTITRVTRELAHPAKPSPADVTACCATPHGRASTLLQHVAAHPRRATHLRRRN